MSRSGVTAVLTLSLTLAACADSAFRPHDDGLAADGGLAQRPDARQRPDGGPGDPDGDGDQACAEVRAEGVRTQRPVDIIMVVDTSHSMGPAVAQVQQSINTAFTDVIDAAGVDYQVILVAGETSASCDKSGCTGGGSLQIAPPLSTSGRLVQHTIATGSGNAYAVVGSTYAQWGATLRPGAFKQFLWFTDSSSGEAPGAGYGFDNLLLGTAPGQFGSAASRNYLLHSIIGILENSPSTAPWLPSQPLQGSACHGGFATGPGPGFQELSILTGGLRFPICQYQHFDMVFQEIAAAVIEDSTVPCELGLPEPPPGQSLDPASLTVEYTPGGGGAPQVLVQAPNAGACVDGAFHVQGDTIRLCPQTCARVSADPQADLHVRFDCLIE